MKRWPYLMTLLALILTVVSAVQPAFSETASPTEAEVLDQLQIGDAWGKSEVTAQSLSDSRPWLSRAARSTANFQHGTATYVGKFRGKFVMATNAHVVAQNMTDLLDRSRIEANPAAICLASRGQSPDKRETVYFAIQEREFECESLVGFWPDIEFSLFSIRVAPEDEIFFENLGITFDSSVPRFGQRLSILGYGEFMNPGAERPSLMKSEDSDCRVFSKTDDIRLIPDPDQFNTGPIRVWSFALGCDVAWGDSGSFIRDLDSGNVIGMIWTAKYPKNPQMKDSSRLKMRTEKDDDEIWGQLSYAVPLSKVRERILSEIDRAPLRAQTAIITDFVQALSLSANRSGYTK